MATPRELSPRQIACLELAAQAVREILRSRTIIYLTLGSTTMFGLVAGDSSWGLVHFQRNLSMRPGGAST